MLLRGTPKQVKYAADIRADILWPRATCGHRNKLQLAIDAAQRANPHLSMEAARRIGDILDAAFWIRHGQVIRRADAESLPASVAIEFISAGIKWQLTER